MGLATAAGIAVRRGLWNRIKTVALTDVGVLVKGLDRDALEEIERVLLEADFGSTSFDLVEALEGELRRGGLKTEDAVRRWLVMRIEEIVGNGESPGHLNLSEEVGPAVVLMLGVNGVGKTTQAAKLAHRLLGRGKTTLLACADTFRAGAAGQLSVWAERLGVPCVSGEPGGDPAAVAYDAIESATAKAIDVVIVDTAGRLHTREDLMGELRKIVRVIGRLRQGAPQESFLVIDGTVGQNAVQQGKAFAEAVPVTGLIVTKLDGTAKGGAVASLPREFGIPIRFLGVGERLEDLEDFEPRRFAERLLGD
jgi:fused signal recognition particle receptor